MAERSSAVLRLRSSAGLAVAALVLVAGCSAGATSRALSGTPVDPPFQPAASALTDTDGQPYSLTTSTDKRLTLVFFGYTRCPDVCGIVMSTVTSALTRLDDADRSQVDVVFVSTDPSRDTGPVLRRYLDRYDPTFIGLTDSSGDVAEVSAIGKTLAVGVSSGQRLPSGGDDLNTHSTQVTGIDSDDQAPMYWGRDTTSQQYAADIHTLLGRP